MSDRSKRTADSRVPPRRASHHPLVRSVDRAEARLHRTLVTLFLLTIPFAVVAAFSLHSEQTSNARDDAAASSTALATTTMDAPAGTIGSDDMSALAPTVLAPARWTTNGVPHVGSVPVTAQSPAGTEVSITVDDQGRRIAPPPTDVDVAVVSVFGAVAMVGLVAIVLVVVRSGFARMYERRREQEWDDAIARLLS